MILRILHWEFLEYIKWKKKKTTSSKTTCGLPKDLYSTTRSLELQDYDEEMQLNDFLWECEHCDYKSLDGNINKKRHYDEMHLDLRLCNCEFCDSKFAERKLNVIHCLRKHPGKLSERTAANSNPCKIERQKVNVHDKIEQTKPKANNHAQPSKSMKCEFQTRKANDLERHIKAHI